MITDIEKKGKADDIPRVPSFPEEFTPSDPKKDEKRCLGKFSIIAISTSTLFFVLIVSMNFFLLP